MDYYDNLINVDFDFKDYSGSSTELKSREGSGHIYQPEQTDNIFHPMRGSEFSIDLLCQTNFALLDLYTVNKRTVKVTVKKAGSTIWTGWLVPNQYNEPYVAPPYFVTVTALDGLGELQTYKWEWKTIMSPAMIIVHCLDKNELDLDIWESVNIYESSMDSDVDNTMMNACYFPTRNYYGMNCYDVLADLLTGLGADIQQVDGAWKIARIREQKGDLVRRKFDASGAFTDNDTQTPTKLIGLAQDNKLAGYSHELYVNPGVHSMRLRKLFEKKLIFLNSDFSDYDKATLLPADWLVSTPLTGQRAFIDQTNIQEFNDFSSGITDGAKSLFQNVDFFKESGILGFQRINLSAEIAVTKQDETDVVATLRLQIIFTGDSGTFYYLDADGSWSTSLTNILFKNIDCEQFKDISWKTLNISNVQIPEDGTLSIYIFAPYKVSGSGTLSKWYIRKCAGDIYHTLYGSYDEYLFLQGIETAEKLSINPNMTYIPDFEIEFKFGDFDPAANTIPISQSGLYRNLFRDAVTSDWTNRGESSTATLQQHLINDYIDYFSQSKWVIRGDILSKTIQFDSTIVDYGVSVKKYYCKGGTYNLRTCRLAGVFHEIGAYEGADWILEDGTWDDDGIWIDDETWNDSDPTP